MLIQSPHLDDPCAPRGIEVAAAIDACVDITRAVSDLYTMGLLPPAERQEIDLIVERLKNMHELGGFIDDA